MAADGKNKPKPEGQAGNAVDGLTPPTIQYSDERTQIGSSPGASATEKTQIGSAPPRTQMAPADLERTQIQPPSAHGSAPGSSPGSKVGSSAGHGSSAGRSSGSATITGDHGLDGLTSDVPEQDLSNERLLKDAPRLTMSGREYPSLNGIPLRSKLGQGGMGAVYYGVHPRLRSEVAVKVLPFHLAAQDPQMIARFYREAQIAAKVRSPHLVNVMDVNEESGVIFLVMEFVAGCTAGQYMKSLIEKGAVGLPEVEALDVIIAATAGLHAAHSNGIVHRDLKPENIMLPYKSRAEKTYDLKHSKLMDLGLARSEEGNQSLTGVQAAMGTPGYMAPEQALDAKTADKRSDVFGMGATLYCLLAGRAPFKGDAIMKVLMATMHEPHEPIGKHRPEVSQALSELLDRCLDKKPENRYQDAHQLLRALRNVRRLVAPEGVDGDDEDDGDLGGRSTSGARVVSAGASMAAATPHYAAPGTGAQQPVPAKSNTLLYVGGGVAALALVAGGAFMAFGGNKVVPDPKANQAISTNNGGGDTKVRPKYTADDLQDARDRFDFAAEKAETFARAGRKDRAQKFMDEARKYAGMADDFAAAGLDAKDLKESGKKLEVAVAKIFNREAFEEKLRQIDPMVARGDFQGALKAIQEASVLDPDSPELESKKAVVIARLESSRKAEEFDKAFKEALALKDKEPEKALALAKKAVGLNPSNFDAIGLVSDLNQVIGERETRKQFAAKLNAAMDLEKANKIAEAMAVANEADALIPFSKEVSDLKARLSTQLSKEAAVAYAKQEEERKEAQFAKALADATAGVASQDFDKALDLLDAATKLKPDHPHIADLRKKATEGREQKLREIAERKKRSEFDATINEIPELLVLNSIDEADKRLAKARTLYPQDKKVVDAETKIKQKKEQIRIQTEFATAIKDANALADTGKFDEADKKVDAALTLIKDEPKALALKRVIAERKKEYQEKSTKVKGIVDEARKLNDAEDFDGALAKLTSAKELLPEFEGLDGLSKLVADRKAFGAEKINGAAAKVGKRDLAGAIADVKQASGQFPDRKDLKLVLAGLEDAVKLQTEVETKVADANKRLTEVTAKLEGRASDQRRRVAGLIESLKGIPAEVIGKFATPANLRNPRAVLEASRGSFTRMSADVDGLLNALRAEADRPPPPPPPPQRQPDPPARGGGDGGGKSGGGVGEQNVFD